MIKKLISIDIKNPSRINLNVQQCLRLIFRRRDIRVKRPLATNQGRSWWLRHTSVKLFDRNSWLHGQQVTRRILDWSVEFQLLLVTSEREAEYLCYTQDVLLHRLDSLQSIPHYKLHVDPCLYPVINMKQELLLLYLCLNSYVQLS